MMFVYVCASVRTSSRKLCMSARRSCFSVWFPSAIASLSKVEISSLVPVFRFGVVVAFSIASTVLARAVLTSRKPHSRSVSLEGAVVPLRLRGCGLKCTYWFCSLWVFLVNFLYTCTLKSSTLATPVCIPDSALGKYTLVMFFSPIRVQNSFSTCSGLAALLRFLAIRTKKFFWRSLPL
jgi:hypothetical protein